jgi:proteic killer suppression protein
MIVGFRDDWLRAFFVDDAHSVNQQWRLIFRWDGERGEVDWIYLDDHSYR